MATIFILGSQGFIGSHLCHYLHGKGHAVTGCDVVEMPEQEYVYHKVNILSSDFELLFQSNGFDVCINASGSGNVGYSMQHPQNDFDVNVNTVAKVLDAIRKYSPACRFLHISSAAVYGNPVSLPVTETAALEPLSPYGYHKLMSEMICREYAGIFGLPVAVTRPFSVFGNGLKKQLLWDICQKLQLHDEISLFGTGDETRDFIHVSDFVKAVEIIIDKSPFKLDIYNLAAGNAIKIKDVAGFFEKQLPGKKIHFSGEVKKGDPSQWQADIAALKNLGFTPSTSFETGVQQYIEWYSRHTAAT